MHKRLPGYLIIALLTACDKPVELAAPPRPALVMTVGESGPETAMTLVGEIRPRYESAQGFRIAGKIIARQVEVGQLVKKGEVLAQLDAADTQLSAAAAESEVRAAEATFALALAEITRQRQLYQKKFISASALDLKESELKAASAQLEKVKAQAKVSGHQSQYAALQADRSGIVTYIAAEPGQVVSAGSPVARIADPNSLEVQIAVPESRIRDIKLQQAVVLKLWADQSKIYPGKVREIAPAADVSTRSFKVQVAIQQIDSALKLGMTAGVKFQDPSAANDAGLIIPSKALTETQGKKQVWVIDQQQRAQLREVVTGPFREDGVIIYSGLQAGETIAIAGVHTLSPGQVVKPQFEQQP